MFTGTSVTLQDMGATQVPIDGQVDEETVVYAYNGIFFILYKEGDPAILTTWIIADIML